MPRTPLSCCNRFAGAAQERIQLIYRLLGRCIHSFPYLILLLIVTSPRFYFGMWFSARLCIAAFLLLACTFSSSAFETGKLRDSKDALTDALLSSRKQQASRGVLLAQQQIHNPHHAPAAAEEGDRS
jgi:hypothetical protein